MPKFMNPNNDLAVLREPEGRAIAAVIRLSWSTSHAASAFVDFLAIANPSVAGFEGRKSREDFCEGACHRPLRERSKSEGGR